MFNRGLLSASINRQFPLAHSERGDIFLWEMKISSDFPDVWRYSRFSENRPLCIPSAVQFRRVIVSYPKFLNLSFKNLYKALAKFSLHKTVIFRWIFGTLKSFSFILKDALKKITHFQTFSRPRTCFKIPLKISNPLICFHGLIEKFKIIFSTISTIPIHYCID